MLFYFINKKASLFLLLAAKECEVPEGKESLSLKRSQGSRTEPCGGGYSGYRLGVGVRRDLGFVPGFAIHWLDNLGHVLSLRHSICPSVKRES